MTLLAFAADRRDAVAQLLLGACSRRSVQQSIDISCPRGTQQQTHRTLLQRSIDGTDQGLKKL